MPRALFLSPDAGSVAFACGGTLCRLLSGGWQVELVTVFGAPSEVSRGAEDEEFCRLVGVENFARWPLDASNVNGDGAIERAIAERLQPFGAPDIVFAPQGLDANASHLQVIRAVIERGWAGQSFWYREIPAALRVPDGAPSELLPASATSGFVGFGEDELQLKIAGCRAYRRQIEREFGDATEFARQLTEFHRAEAEATAQPEFAERFLN